MQLLTSNIYSFSAHPPRFIKKKKKSSMWINAEARHYEHAALPCDWSKFEPLQTFHFLHIPVCCSQSAARPTTQSTHDVHSLLAVDRAHSQYHLVSLSKYMNNSKTSFCIKLTKHRGAHCLSNLAFPAPAVSPCHHSEPNKRVIMVLKPREVLQTMHL